MSFRLRVFPHGVSTWKTPDAFCVSLILVDGASWQKGEITFEFSAGQNKFPTKEMVLSWSNNNNWRGGGVGWRGGVEQVKKAKTMNIVAMHLPSLGARKFPEEFKVKTEKV